MNEEMECKHDDNDWQWLRFCGNCGESLAPDPLDLQPHQPIREDSNGVQRFRENAIVRYLLDNGSTDMNKLAVLSFPREDRIQFAQLIGYSVCGFGDLDYVDDLSYQEALRGNEEESS